MAAANIETQLETYKTQNLTYDEALWLLQQKGISPSRVKRQTSYTWERSEVLPGTSPLYGYTDKTDDKTEALRSLPVELKQGVRAGRTATLRIIAYLVVWTFGMMLYRTPFISMIGLALATGAVIAGFIQCLQVAFSLRLFWFYETRLLGTANRKLYYINNTATLIGLALASVFVVFATVTAKLVLENGFIL